VFCAADDASLAEAMALAASRAGYRQAITLANLGDAAALTGSASDEKGAATGVRGGRGAAPRTRKVRPPV
jgi:hypothetical protein